MPSRPYICEFEGKKRMVSAPGPAEAVRHVVGKNVTELRPATGADVAAWVAAGNKIEVAGEQVAPAAAKAAGADGAG